MVADWHRATLCDLVDVHWPTSQGFNLRQAAWARGPFVRTSYTLWNYWEPWRRMAGRSDVA